MTPLEPNGENPNVGGVDFLSLYLDLVCEGRLDHPRVPLVDIASAVQQKPDPVYPHSLQSAASSGFFLVVQGNQVPCSIEALKNISYSVVKDNKYELVGKALNCEFIIHQRAQYNGLRQYILIHSSRQPHPISSLTPSLICMFNFPTSESALLYFFKSISTDEILATILTSHQANCIGSLTRMRDTFINPMLFAISTRASTDKEDLHVWELRLMCDWTARARSTTITCRQEIENPR